MSENQKQNVAVGQAKEEPVSPSEKIEQNKPLGSLVPGAENVESEEIKKEINPNTE
ncbi:MAG TPA: hypothetical protein VF543_17675 [Pyrinomonadaceae bacterium]|jgi:hypothetical protein